MLKGIYIETLVENEQGTPSTSIKTISAYSVKDLQEMVLAAQYSSNILRAWCLNA
jgi:hypothetical protein